MRTAEACVVFDDGIGNTVNINVGRTFEADTPVAMIDGRLIDDARCCLPDGFQWTVVEVIHHNTRSDR